MVWQPGEQVAIVIPPGGVVEADFPTAFKDYRTLLRKFNIANRPDGVDQGRRGLRRYLYAAEVLENPVARSIPVAMLYLGSEPGNPD